MGATWVGRLSAPLGTFLILANVCWGDEPGLPGTEEASATAPAPAVPGPPKAEQGPSATGDTTGPPWPGAEAKAARAETLERLGRLAKASEKDLPASSVGKGLREVLEDRLHWLDEWDKAAKARHDAEHPEPSPEREAARLRTELERVKALLDQSAKDPSALLPEVFLAQPGQVNDATRAEMKEALDAAKGDLKDWKAKLERLRADLAKTGGALSLLRAERDKLHQRVASLKSRGDEREAAVAAAKTPEEAELARERLVNFALESRVESERLQVQEVRLTLEVSRGNLAAPSLQVLEGHVQLAARTLERMQKRYGLVSVARERELEQAAASERKRAAHADDPLVKYRARRTAELFELQAQVVTFENQLATSPYPSFGEQRSLTDRAASDFERVKGLLKDGKVSHLDALRLNNDFRRIGPERARIVSHELAAAASQLTFYENALSAVEIDLINDSRDDLLQHADLLDRLPKSRHGEAQTVFEDIEAQHLALLERKRLALEKLADRADQTHVVILRRLKTLDDLYGFIRTHIFWVRDQEPVGVATLGQCRRELWLLGRSTLAMILEACDRSNWGRVSAEFAAAALALIGLPWPLRKLQKSLGTRCHAANAP